MSSLRRQIARLALAVPLLGGAPLTAQSIDDLTGGWQPPRQARAAEVKTRALGEAVLGGAWVQLAVHDEHASGRRHSELVMLRQGTDGVVEGFRFEAGSDTPLRLEGRWTAERRLELAGADGATKWAWSLESACAAVLRRAPAPEVSGASVTESRLRRASCEPTQVAAAEPPAATPSSTPEGRSPEAKPAPVASTAKADPPSDPAADELEERLAEGHLEPPVAADEPEEKATGGGAEVEVADLPATRAPAASRQDPMVDAAASARTILVSGRGRPYDEVKKAIEMLRDFLSAKGVAVEAPSDEIVVLQAADSSLAYLVRETRDRGAASLLYVTASFGGRERIIVDCYDANGLQLWRERVVGGTGMRDFKWVNPKLVERMQQRLESRIGGPGLPLSAGEGS